MDPKKKSYSGLTLDILKLTKAETRKFNVDFTPLLEQTTAATVCPDAAEEQTRRRK